MQLAVLDALLCIGVHGERVNDVRPSETLLMAPGLECTGRPDGETVNG